jgi:hypothetical protein
MTGHPRTVMLMSEAGASSFVAENARRRGVAVYPVLRGGSSTPMRALRRVHLGRKLPGHQLWFGEWSRQPEAFDRVVIHAANLHAPALTRLRRLWPAAEIIYWYWNPVSPREHPRCVPPGLCEQWSFDEDDCRRYGFSFNDQFYFTDLQLPDVPVRNDAVFIGADKGRLQRILGVQDEFTRLGLSIDVHLVKSPDSDPRYRDLWRPNLTYSEVLAKIAGARAIVDLKQNGQSGLTLRPLEALTFGKKLITDDLTITGRDFYDPSTVFLVGQDDPSRLADFLHSQPNDPTGIERVQRYDFDRWLERFFEASTHG